MGFGPNKYEGGTGPSHREFEAVKEQAKATADRLAKLELWIEHELLPRIARLDMDFDEHKLQEQIDYEQSWQERL